MINSKALMAEASWENPRLKGRISELDGVRGLAILLVLFWHYAYATIPIPKRAWKAYLLLPLSITWSGVDLFFVLSGFLIGGILYEAKDSASYFKTFYGRRIFRIFPVYFAWLLLFLAGLFVVEHHSSSQLTTLFNRVLPVWSYPLFIQNVFMSSRQTFGAQWMGITWSLAVEEQFYLLLPFLIRRLSYRGITQLAVAAILLAPIVRLILRASGNSYFGPYTLLPCRADALGFGLLIAMACRNKNVWAWLESHRSQLYAVFLALACGVVALILRPQYFYTVGLSWMPAFYASILLLTLVNPGRIEILLFRSHLLTKLGTLAYAVYMFHQGVNILFHLAVFGQPPKIVSVSSLAVTFASLASVLLLAAISWRFMEKPLIRYAHFTFQYTPLSSPTHGRDSLSTAPHPTSSAQ